MRYCHINYPELSFRDLIHGFSIYLIVVTSVKLLVVTFVVVLWLLLFSILICTPTLNATSFKLRYLA